MNTWAYLERLRALNEGCSDYRLAKLLDVRQQALVNYRQGREMDDTVAIKVASLLDLPAAQVVADVNAARAESANVPEVVAVWKQISAAFARPGLTSRPAAVARSQRRRKKLVGARGFEPPTTTTPR